MAAKKKRKTKHRKKKEIDTVAQLSKEELRALAKQKTNESLSNYELICLPDIEQYRIWNNHTRRDTGKIYKTREEAEEALKKLEEKIE